MIEFEFAYNFVISVSFMILPLLANYVNYYDYRLIPLPAGFTFIITRGK